MARAHEIVLDALDRHYEQLEYEIREKTELKAAIGLVRSHFQGARCVLCNSMSSRPIDKPEINLAGVSVDFRGAGNLLERVIRIGEAVEAEGKLLNATEVARFLIGMRQSGSRLDVLRRSVRDVLNNHPHYFEYLHPGTYRFLGRNGTLWVRAVGFHGPPAPS